MALFSIVKDAKNSAICQPIFWRTKMISGLSRLSHFKTSFARASDWKFSEHACMPDWSPSLKNLPTPLRPYKRRQRQFWGPFRKKSQFASALSTFHGPFGELRYIYNFFQSRQPPVLYFYVHKGTSILTSRELV